jgi:hypothetical protein
MNGVKTLITVDEFYDNPYEVRKFALTAGYPVPHEGKTYPGRNSEKSYYPEWMDQKISEIAGEPLELNPGQMNGTFRVSLAGDTYKQDIHSDMFHTDDPADGNQWAGVLYLTAPEYCVDENGNPYSGTKLWRHKRLGWERVPMNQEEGAKFGYTNYTMLRDDVIEGDGIDRSKWTETANVGMVFNRLTMFRPWMFHSAGIADGLGDNLINGRLVQVFFWRRKK